MALDTVRYESWSYHQGAISYESSKLSLRTRRALHSITKTNRLILNKHPHHNNSPCIENSYIMTQSKQAPMTLREMWAEKAEKAEKNWVW